MHLWIQSVIYSKFKDQSGADFLFSALKKNADCCPKEVFF